MELGSDGRGATLYPAPAMLLEAADMADAGLEHALLMSTPVEHLLVAADFAGFSSNGIERALERGKALGAQVTLLHVVEEASSPKATRLLQCEARELLTERLQSVYRTGHNDVSISVRVGEPYLEILREAIELGSDAIVLGLGAPHHDNSKALATAIEVVSYSDKPVLLVAQRPTGPYCRSVLDVDHSVTFGCIVRAAQRLAPHAETHFFHTPSISADRPDALQAKPANASIDPVDALMDRVGQVGAELLVANSGSHQEWNSSTSLLQHVLAAPRCDLLLVREHTVPYPAGTRCPGGLLEDA